MRWLPGSNWIKLVCILHQLDFIDYGEVSILVPISARERREINVDALWGNLNKTPYAVVQFTPYI